ncbi:MAG: cyanophycin synthetase, partial [Patescibacteria group bacterium]
HPRYPRLAQLAKKTKAIAVPGATDLPLADRDIPLLGLHNRENVQLAVRVARILDIEDKTIKRAIRSFVPLPHRLQNVGTYKEITFYDDAISTTPQSTLRAIESFPNIGAMLLGGQNRGYDFGDLAREIARRKIPVLVLFPDSGIAIASALKKVGYTPEAMLETRDMHDAVQFVYNKTPQQSVCLLSTASPSYSVWKNFEEKGDLFQMYVKKFGEQR